MAYTVLARKYRPQTFSDLVGQEHVTRTLGNAIGSERVAHAFLFTGVRGVGKTTTARVLAKALNCQKGPTPEPCGTCDPCREIATGIDLDVLEIDGASNNSVDDVRRLQETIPFRPARDRFKIVIVDEVHMLSTGAFNAFLKTLEEPPPHVKFIFATTEAHKVPVTIRSRCQRYDFRLIPQSLVAVQVRKILTAEGLTADDAAVSIVAREAAGSMRDALTLLDQIVAFSEGAIEGEEVARLLGIADRELLHRAAESVLLGEPDACIGVVEALAGRGLDILHFARGLTELMRDLVVLQVSGPDTDRVALVEEERRRATDLAGRVEPLEVQRAFASLSLLIDEIAKASMPRLVFEMGLVRLASRPPLRALAEVVARLEALERGGSTPPSSGGGGSGRTNSSTAAPRQQRGSSADGYRAQSGSSLGVIAQLHANVPSASPHTRIAGATSSPRLAPVSPIAPASVSVPASASAPATLGVPAKVGEPSASVVALDTQSSVSLKAPSASDQDVADDPVGPGSGLAFPVAILIDAPANQRGEPAEQPTDSRPASVLPGAARTLEPAAVSPPSVDEFHSIPSNGGPPVDDVDASPPVDDVAAMPLRSLVDSDGLPRVRAFSEEPRSKSRGSEPTGLGPQWENIVAVLMDTQPALGAVLLHGTPQRVDSEQIVIAFPPRSFYGRQADTNSAKDLVAEVARRFLGTRPKIRIIERESSAPGGTLAEVEAERQRARLEATKKKAINHPMVVEALSIFEMRAEAAVVHLEGD